jgi:hypothetical protein
MILGMLGESAQESDRFLDSLIAVTSCLWK